MIEEAIAPVIGPAVGGLIVGVLAALSVLGKIVNNQVRRSFDQALNGDGNGSKGLRDDLDTVKKGVETICTNVNTLVTSHAVMAQYLEGREKQCDERHGNLNKTIERLEAREVPHV